MSIQRTLAAVAITAVATLSTTATAHADNEENEWNCATEGNHLCGPGVVPPMVPPYCTRIGLDTGNTLWIEELPTGSRACAWRV